MNADTHQQPVLVINTFTLRPGCQREFIRLQAEFGERLRATASAPGLLGSRMHRSVDGRRAVLESLFDSLDSQKQLMATEEFARHRKRIEGLIERADPAVYEVAYEVGVFAGLRESGECEIAEAVSR